MRFYATARSHRILLPLLNLTLCVIYIATALRRPSSEHTLFALCWTLIFLTNAITSWGIFWQVTPNALIQTQFFFTHRLIPYNIIQNVSPNDTPNKDRNRGYIKITILMDKPILARPDDYAAFAAALEQHLSPGILHI